MTTTTNLWNELVLDNALVNQKNSLLKDIQDIESMDDSIAEGQRKIAAAAGCVVKQLELIKDMWNASGYSYKLHELTTRLKVSVAKAIGNARSDQVRDGLSYVYLRLNNVSN